MSDSTFGFIGLGLIGGSIARGLRRANKDITIMAYMRTRSKLEQAKADGTIDIILDGIDETLSACDVIFLCTPVEYNAVYLEKVRPFLKPGALITDIGSTKTDIHQAVERLGYEDVFVGGHPMAGSEKTGYESSTDHLLENAYYIITPTKKYDYGAPSRNMAANLTGKKAPEWTLNDIKEVEACDKLYQRTPLVYLRL